MRRAQEFASVLALILANVPWLSTVAAPVVWIGYVAAELALYATVRAPLSALSERFPKAIERGLVLIGGLAVVAQLIVLLVVRPLVHIAMDRDSALLTWQAAFARGDFPYAYP